MQNGLADLLKDTLKKIREYAMQMKKQIFFMMFKITGLLSAKLTKAEINRSKAGVDQFNKDRANCFLSWLSKGISGGNGADKRDALLKEHNAGYRERFWRAFWNRELSRRFFMMAELISIDHYR